MATPTPVFPAAVATDAQLKVANNLIQSALMAAIGPADTTIYVASATGFRANSLVSIDAEIISITAVSTSPAALTVGTRGFDGTTAAAHSAGVKVSMYIDAWHHNAVTAEVKAIEQFLGPNGINLPSQPFVASGLYPAGSYVFTPQTPGGSLIAGANVITLTPVPQGVNGSDTLHYLCISGGTGAMEAVLITGGTAVSGAASGTVIVNCGHAHSGAWTIATATAGIQEAYQYIVSTAGAGAIMVPNKENDICGQISISAPNIVIQGAGWSSIIKALPNVGLSNGLVHVYSAAVGFGIYNLTLDGNAQNGGTSGNTAVVCCLFLGASNARVSDCQIKNGNRVGIFFGDTTVTVTDVLISGCYITGNGGRLGYVAGQNSGYFGLAIFGGGAATPNNIRIIGNTMYDNHNFDTGPGDGCAINITATHVSIIGNYFQDNFNQGGGQVFLVGSGPTTTGPSYSVISGNEICCTKRFGTPQDYTAGIECQASGVTITGNYIHDMPAYGILLDNEQTGPPVSGPITINGNTIVNLQYGIGIHPSNASFYISHVNITGNSIFNASQYGVVLYQTSDHILIRNNDLNTAAQGVAGSGTNCEVTDNSYYPNLTPITVTMTASPMTYTSSFYKEQISIVGASTLSVVLQGSITVGANTPDFTYSLNPNTTIVITYTGTPTMSVYYLS